MLSCFERKGKEEVGYNLLWGGGGEKKKSVNFEYGVPLKWWVSRDCRGLVVLLWMQPMNKELGPNVLWAADRYPTERAQVWAQGRFVSFIINCGLRWMKEERPERWREGLRRCGRGGWRQMKAKLEGRLLRGLGSRSSRESMMVWVDKKESRSGRKTEKRESWIKEIKTHSGMDGKVRDEKGAEMTAGEKANGRWRMLGGEKVTPGGGYFLSKSTWGNQYTQSHTRWLDLTSCRWLWWCLQLWFAYVLSLLWLQEQNN